MSSFFDTNVPLHGWLAEELSRAISHIHVSNAMYSDSPMPTSTRCDTGLSITNKQFSTPSRGPRSPQYNHAICLEELSSSPMFRHLTSSTSTSTSASDHN